MDKCFVPCGCDSRETVTRSDLDRFTDKVENVLNDEKGKRLFWNFMRTCKMKDGCRKLELLEDIDKIVNKRADDEEAALKSLFRKAERIDELDLALMEKLNIARSSENKEDMTAALMLLKTATVKTFRTEYNAFRRHYTPSK